MLCSLQALSVYGQYTKHLLLLKGIIIDMNLNVEDLKKQYKNNGFFVIKNFLNINPKILIDDILSSDSTERYYDK